MVSEYLSENVFNQFENVSIHGSQVAFKDNIMQFSATILAVVERLEKDMDINYIDLQESIEEQLYGNDFILDYVLYERIIAEYVSFHACVDEPLEKCVELLKEVKADCADYDNLALIYAEYHELDDKEVSDEIDRLL